MRKILVIEKEFNKKIAYIIKIYMKRTTLDFETIKKLLLKNQKALNLFKEPYIRYCDIYITANILIGVTLLKKINEDDLYSIMPLTERDKQIIDLMDNEKFNYLVDENSLDEIKYVIEELNIEG